MKFAVNLLNSGVYIHCQVCNLMHGRKQGARNIERAITSNYTEYDYYIMWQ